MEIQTQKELKMALEEIVRGFEQERCKQTNAYQHINQVGVSRINYIII